MDITAILKRCAGLWAFQIVLHLSMTLKEKVTQHINTRYIVANVINIYVVIKE